MAPTLDSNGLAVDYVWTSEQYGSLQQEIAELASKAAYYHRVRIRDQAGQVLETPGTHPTSGVITLLDQVGFPRSLAGKTVLDVGCNAGFYSAVASIRGAARVLGVDSQSEYVDQALMLRRVLRLTPEEVEFRVGNGHDLGHGTEAFDYVINTGVVYHLQNPMDFLVKMASVTNEVMLLESEMLLDPAYAEYAWFIEKEYGGDSTNWWIYGPTCLERMARAAGFAEVTFQGFIWKPEPGTRTTEGHPRQGRGFFICRKSSGA